MAGRQLQHLIRVTGRRVETEHVTANECFISELHLVMCDYGTDIDG